MKDLRQLLATSIYISHVYKFLVKSSSLRNPPSSIGNSFNVKIKHSMNLYSFFLENRKVSQCLTTLSIAISCK